MYGALSIFYWFRGNRSDLTLMGLGNTTRHMLKGRLCILDKILSKLWIIQLMILGDWFSSCIKELALKIIWLLSWIANNFRSLLAQRFLHIWQYDNCLVAKLINDTYNSCLVDKFTKLDKRVLVQNFEPVVVIG